MLPPSPRVVLYDYPNHPNCGDAAIWLGELALLRELNAEITMRVQRLSYNRSAVRRALGSDGILLLHGGGHLGDLYPLQRAVRERVIDDFPDVPIVHMPVSVWFQSQESMRDHARAVERHGGVTILARDQQSLAALADFDCRTELTPDAAFRLGRIDAPAATQDAVWLLRRDKERRREPSDADGPSIDWDFDERGPLRWTRKATVAASLLSARAAFPGAHLPAGMLFDRLATWRLRRGVERLAPGRVIVTDRLHGHILAILMGRPTIVLDSIDGKVHSFTDTWTGAAEDVHPVQDAGEARALLAELLQT